MSSCTCDPKPRCKYSRQQSEPALSSSTTYATASLDRRQLKKNCGSQLNHTCDATQTSCSTAASYATLPWHYNCTCQPTASSTTSNCYYCRQYQTNLNYYASASCPNALGAYDAQQLNYYYYPNYYQGYYCGHQCCYQEFLKSKQQQFEQNYSGRDRTPRKVDKSTNTMNGTVSPASSASPPPAPPPLPISVRASYCARCRFNIAHSRHDLSSNTAHLPNGSLPTGGPSYGIPQNAYTGEPLVLLAFCFHHILFNFMPGVTHNYIPLTTL